MSTVLLPLLVSVALAAGGGGEGTHHAGDIPWGPIGFHALNLAVLIGVILYFAGKPIKDAIAARAGRVRRELEESAAMRESAQKRYDELTARLDGFETQLAEMRANAEVEAAREREEILARAAREARMVEEAAERTIRSESARAKTELRQEAVRLAVRLAEQRVRGQLRPEDEERLASEFLGAVREVPNG